MENRLHWVRDVTLDEDHSQVHTGNGPHIMASLRNLALTVLRLTSITNITAALRHHARHRHQPLKHRHDLQNTTLPTPRAAVPTDGKALHGLLAAGVTGTGGGGGMTWSATWAPTG